MANQNMCNAAVPIAPLKIAALEGSCGLAQKVNRHILEFRNNGKAGRGCQGNPDSRDDAMDSFLLGVSCPRSETGEAKAAIQESVRGTDLFLLADVTCHSVAYPAWGHVNHLSPDGHFQNLKRVIGACVAAAYRINVMMPFLYEGRQHRRDQRESLDCAIALNELAAMGVSNIITFDAHDPRVENAVPLDGFDNFMPTYPFIRTLFCHGGHPLETDKSRLMAISPDEGSMGRAVYLANHLGVDMGMFYKRRDYSRAIDGRGPVVAHEFLGPPVKGKTALIIDDMIASGESMLDTARELKRREAAKVVICCTFGLFTKGLEKFDEFYHKGYIDCVATTNLNYRPQELLQREWYLEADMSRYVAAIIYAFNHNRPIGKTLGLADKTQRLVPNCRPGT